jgi:hypothetical protein
MMQSLYFSKKNEKKLFVFKFDGLQKRAGCHQAINAYLGLKINEYYFSSNNWKSVCEFSWVCFYGPTTCKWTSCLI